MATKRIVFRQNRKKPDLRMYGPQMPVSETEVAYFESPLSYDEDSLDIGGLTAIGDIGELIVAGVLAIDGVSSLYIERYQIGVTKAMGYKWGRIHKEILKVIRGAIGESYPDCQKVKVLKSKKRRNKPNEERGTENANA